MNVQHLVNQLIMALIKYHIMFNLELFLAVFNQFNLLSGCSYYEGLQKCLGLMTEGKVYTSEQVEKLVELYDGLRVKYPRSAAAKVRLLYPTHLSY